jgi:hypothetical protein
MCQVDWTELSRAKFRPVWAMVSTLGESEILHSEIPHRRDVSWWLLAEKPGDVG